MRQAPDLVTQISLNNYGQKQIPVKLTKREYKKEGKKKLKLKILVR